jgi:putative toxin-antitoxin system antitoxin component (TIGR02293 family)
VTGDRIRQCHRLQVGLLATTIQPARRASRAQVGSRPLAHNLTERPTAAFSVLDEILEWLAPGGESARKTVLKVLAIPERTLARRKAAGGLREDETDRILRLLRLKGQVERMFHGDSARAARWITSPSRGLGGHTPLEAAATERGTLRVTDLIGQTMHGVVS